MKGLPSDDDTWRVGQTIADLCEVRGINRKGGMAMTNWTGHQVATPGTVQGRIGADIDAL